MEFIATTSADPLFAQLMFPVFEDEQLMQRIRNETDADLAMHTPAGHTWFLAVDGGTVAGLCTTVRGDMRKIITRPDVNVPDLCGEVAFWENNFVRPEYRGRGVFATLAAVRQQHASSYLLPVLTYVFRPLLNWHLARGFQLIGQGSTVTPDGTAHDWFGLHRP